MATALKSVGWLAMFFFACVLFYTTAEYLSLRTDINFLLVKDEEISNVLWMGSFYVHITSAMVVLVVGPIQFIKNLRNKNIRLHRTLGKIYVWGVLFFAAPSGLIMAFYAEGGFWSTIGFGLMSLLWFFATFMAVKMAIAKKITEHQKWMYRSYALTFAAVTLRLLIPWFSTFIYNDQFITVSTAWLSWIINLMVVEVIIFLTLRKEFLSMSDRRGRMRTVDSRVDPNTQPKNETR